MDFRSSESTRSIEKSLNSVPKSTQNRSKIVTNRLSGPLGWSPRSTLAARSIQECLGASPARPGGVPKAARECPKLPQGCPGEPKRARGSARRHLETTKIGADAPRLAREDIHFTPPGNTPKTCREHAENLPTNAVQPTPETNKGAAVSRSELNKDGNKNIEK